MGKGSRRGGGSPSPGTVLSPEANIGSGAGSTHTPVEAKETSRSKQLIKIVEVISEGEVAGLALFLFEVSIPFNTFDLSKDASAKNLYSFIILKSLI